MASGSKTGVGRGRGIRSQTSEVSPGFVLKDLSGPKATPMDHLEALICNMRLEDNECEVEPVKFAFREAIKTDDDLNGAINLLISRSLQEDKFASTAVQLCADLSDVVAESVTCRTAFLKLLQANYNKKEEFRRERPPVKWIGCVALVCHSLSRIRMPDNSPMKPIVVTALDCVLSCLESAATAQELECAADQILNVGDILLEYGNNSKMLALGQAVFDVIIEGRGSEATRKKLLCVVEMLNKTRII